MNLERMSSCTYPLREQPVDYALAVTAEAGLGKVDLWGGGTHFKLNTPECNFADLRATAAQHNIRIANLGSYPGRLFAHEDPLLREAELAMLKAVLYAARALGSRSVRVLPGVGEDPAQIERLIPCFAEGAQLAEELGVYMGMENHAGSLAGDPEVVLKLCQGVGSKYFGVLYEPCNLMHGGECYQRAFELLQDYIVHIHIKDGRHGPEGWQRCHLGEGEIDYPWVIKALESTGYSGDYALEYEICDLEPIETGLKKWVATFAAMA